MGRWWEQTPWRLIQTNLRQIDMADIDATTYVAQLVAFNATVVMINTGGIIASYPTQVADHTQSDYLTGDSLQQIMDACHEAGIRVIARMDFSKIRRPVYEKHPDWAYRTRQGEIVDYNGDVHACLCGGFQQEKAFEIMEEVAAKLPIDGVFMNMGGFQTHDYSYRYYGICHCEHCKRLFGEQYGLPLPQQEDLNDPIYRQYRIFQHKTMTDYKQRMTALIRSINPEIAIDGVDFIRNESNTEYKQHRSWPFATSSFVRGFNARGIPCSNTTVDFIGFYYRHVAVSPYLQALRLWQTLACYGRPDYYLIGRLDNHGDRSGFESIRQVFAHHAAHQDKYANMSLYAEVLVLRNLYSTESRGWISALTECHILLNEAELGFAQDADALSKYKVIIAADLDTLPESIADNLNRYVANGGCLIVSGHPPRYKENGDEWAHHPLTCLGITARHGIRKDMVSAMLMVKDKEMFPSFVDMDYLYIGDDFQFSQYDAAVEPYLSLIPPHPYGPPERCYHTQVTDIPGMTINHCGKGRAIHIPWDPSLLYARDGYHNTFCFMKDVLTQGAGLTSVEAKPFSPMVEVTVGFENNGNHALIQLVNNTGCFGHSYIEPVPVTDIHLKIPMPAVPIRVVSLTNGEIPDFTWHTAESQGQRIGQLICHVKCLQAYEAIWVLMS